eukprot:727034_1
MGILRIQSIIKEPDENADPSASQNNGGNLLDMSNQSTFRCPHTFQNYAFRSRMKAPIASFSTFLARRHIESSKAENALKSHVSEACGDSSPVRAANHLKRSPVVQGSKQWAGSRDSFDNVAGTVGLCIAPIEVAVVRIEMGGDPVGCSVDFAKKELSFRPSRKVLG